MTAVTFNQIRAELAALRRKRSIEKPVGIRSPGRWLGGEVQNDGELTYAIAQCDSPLALREALRRQPAGADETAVRVVITSLPDAAIAPDIFARLHRQRLFSIDRWSLVQQLFSADSLDPRLVQHDWLADAVVEHLGGRSLPAAKSGFLDADSLWRELLTATIGLAVDVPDLAALFRWSLDPDNIQRLRQLSGDLRTGIEGWLRGRAGPAADFVFAVADRTAAADAVPLALAVGVLVNDAAGSKAERPLGKLEGTWLTSRPLTATDLRRSAEEAATTLRAAVTDPLEQRRITARAEELLASVEAAAFAHVSDILPLGYTQRLGTFAAAARAFAADPAASPEPVEQAAARVRVHDQLLVHPGDSDRMKMALRLVRWLHTEPAAPPPPGSLAEAARRYLATGSYVDWARTTIGRVAASRELSDAIASVHEAASRQQEQAACQFAGLLAESTAAGVLPAGINPIERVLDETVVPLARSMPVLLVVLDGMSAAVCRELVASIVATRNVWGEIAPEAAAAIPPALAAIPSETKYSRASLLAGRLAGDVRDEQAAFAAHPGLREVCAAGGDPRLFAKGDFGQGGKVTDLIRDEIASSGRRVVAVIVNAIDDHLSKADQVDFRWTQETIQPLDGLLHEAAAAGRAVVLTSDHGHVLDRGTEARVKDGGERWRPAGDPLEADELVLRGPRVLAPGGEIVTSWSEAVRYIAPMKRGYHGGANPQEMIVPIAVLAPADKPEPAGWRFLPESSPAWWEEGGASAPLVSAAPAHAPATPPGMLFDIHATAPPAPPRPVSDGAGGTVQSGVEAPPWVAELLASEIFAQQKEIVGRAHPGDELIGRLLAALAARGGKLTKAALARAIAYPLFRLPGLLSNTQRVLNIDGFAVIGVDAESDTVVLDHPLLLVQFGLAAGGGRGR